MSSKRIYMPKKPDILTGAAIRSFRGPVKIEPVFQTDLKDQISIFDKKFLHSHPKTEDFHNLADDHVIVDKPDWEKARKICELITRSGRDILQKELLECAKAGLVEWDVVIPFVPKELLHKYRGLILIKKLGI